MTPTIEEFVAVLNESFAAALRAKPGNLWSPEQVLEEYQRTVTLTLAYFAGTAP